MGYSPWDHKESNTTEHTVQRFNMRVGSYDCVSHSLLGWDPE